MPFLLDLIKKRSFLILCVALMLTGATQMLAAQFPVPEMDPRRYPAPNMGCLAPGKCHAGIEPIRAHNSGMAKEIYEMGEKMGDPKKPGRGRCCKN